MKLVNADISVTPGHRSGRQRFNFIRITFEMLYADPHFEIVTDTLVAHVRANYSEDLEFSCEVVQGTQSAAIAYIIDEAIKESLPNFGLDVCQWTNPEEGALFHLPSTLEDIDFWFDPGHTVDIEELVRFVEKMRALKKFNFVAAYRNIDVPRMFFENAAVQKLSSIKFHSLINAEIDDELIQKFTNTELVLEEGFTQVTWRGVRDAIQAWKDNKISKLEWAFYVKEEEEEPAIIWKKLLGDVDIHPNSTSQCIERSRMCKKRRNMPPPTVESLAINLLYYDSERKMQKIQIQPTKAEQAKR